MKVTDGTNTAVYDAKGFRFTDTTGGTTITNAPSISITGIDAGSKQITNVASAGDITNIANQYNAVNAGDVNKAVTNLVDGGLKFGANAGDVYTAKLGSTVNIKGADANTDWTKFDAGQNIMTQVDNTGLVRVALAKDLNVNTVTIGAAGSSTTLSSSSNGLDVGGSKITNVAAGEVSATSSDAINGSQLFAVQENITKLDDFAVKYDSNTDGTVNRNSVTLGGTQSTATKDATTGLITTTGGTSLNNVASAGDITDVANANKAVNAGDLNNQVVNLKNEITNVGAAARTEVVAGENITVTSSTGTSGQSIYTVATAKDVKFDSVTADDGKGNTTTLNASGTSVKNAAGDTANYGASGTKLTDNSGNQTTVSASGMAVTDGTHSAVYDAKGIHFTNSAGTTINNAPSVTQAGVDGGGQRITNVGNAVNPTDAVNLGQLNAAMNNNLGAVHSRINTVAKDAFAGAASAMASAGLPQAYMPGKSMVAIAGSTFKNQSAVALGISSITDNGKWVIKGTVNSNSRGDVGATIGTGYQW